MDIFFQSIVCEVVVPVVLWPLLVFGFVVYQEVISEISSLCSLHSDPNEALVRSYGLEQLNTENDTVARFYLQKWQLITDLIPDKFHSHIGGILASKFYLEKLDLKPTDKLLDIGCGYGGMLILAAQKKICEGWGIDSTTNRIIEAREAAQLLGLTETLEFVNKDFLSWETPPLSTFDAVLVLDVLIHIVDKDKLFSKLSGLMRPQGRLLIADYFSETGFSHQNSLIFQDPAINPPYKLTDFRNILDKLDLQIKWQEDRTSIATDETRKLIRAIEDARTKLLLKYKTEDIEIVINLLRVWEELLSERMISYRAFLLSKI